MTRKPLHHRFRRFLRDVSDHTPFARLVVLLVLLWLAFAGGLYYVEHTLDHATITTFGEALYYITCAYAQLERGIIAERVKAGMNRAAREGKRIGRPRVTERKGFQKRFKSVLERLRSKELSHRKAAKELGIGHATLLRLLRQQDIS